MYTVYTYTSCFTLGKEIETPTKEEAGKAGNLGRGSKRCLGARLVGMVECVEGNGTHIRRNSRVSFLWNPTHIAHLYPSWGNCDCRSRVSPVHDSRYPNSLVK